MTEAPMTETVETVNKDEQAAAEASTQQGAEPTEKVNDVNTEEVTEEGEIDLYGGYKPMATAAAAATDPEKVNEQLQSLKEENLALLGKIESLTSELERLSQMYDHPIIQSAKKLVENDADANIAAFMDIAATSNPRKMKPEQIYQMQMADFLVKKGFKGEELTQRIDDALERFSDKDDIEQEMTIQAFREKLIYDFDEKTKKYLGTNDEEKQRQANIQKANENNFLVLKSEIERLAKQGSLGVFKLDDNWQKMAVNKLQTVFRFDDKMNVDVAHAIKVINYAINPDAVEKELVRVGKTKVTTEKIVNHSAKPEKDIIADEKKMIASVKSVFDAQDEIIRKRREQNNKQAF